MDTCGKCNEAKKDVKSYSLPQAGGVTLEMMLCASCARKTAKSLPPQKSTSKK